MMAMMAKNAAMLKLNGSDNESDKGFNGEGGLGNELQELEEMNNSMNNSFKNDGSNKWRRSSIDDLNRSFSSDTPKMITPKQAEQIHQVVSVPVIEG